MIQHICNQLSQIFVKSIAHKVVWCRAKYWIVFEAELTSQVGVTAAKKNFYCVFQKLNGNVLIHLLEMA